MYININQIKNQIDNGFSNAYKPFASFKNSGALWDSCIDAVSDVDLLNNIIFCNNNFNIPPVRTFLSVYKNIDNLSNTDKKSIGAFWGFVFKFIFKYQSQRSVAINTGEVKSATYFYNNPDSIKVI